MYVYICICKAAGEVRSNLVMKKGKREEKRKGKGEGGLVTKRVRNIVVEIP